MRRVARFLAVSLILAASNVAAAEVRLPPPTGDAWRPLEFPKISRHTLYEAVPYGDTVVLKAQADCSASAMVVPAGSIDLRATPLLRWRWKLEKGIDIADETKKAGDDFAARVYVMFRFDSENASLWERAKHALVRQIYGESVPGNAINYVWSSGAVADSSWKSPYSDAAQIIVKQSGVADGWVEAAADVATDYRASFGHEPPAMLSLALMSDTDNTCQKAVAYFADFRFTAAPEP